MRREKPNTKEEAFQCAESIVERSAPAIERQLGGKVTWERRGDSLFVAHDGLDMQEIRIGWEGSGGVMQFVNLLEPHCPDN